MLNKMQITEGDITKVKAGQDISFTILSEPDMLIKAKLDSVDSGLTTMSLGSYTTSTDTHIALEYKSIIRKLRAVRPNIQISSDFIVGFPGETNEEFEQTMNLIAQVNFDMSFSFIYSARPGTPAADMPDDVTEEEKKQRLYLLQERINQQAAQYSRRMLGTE